MNYIIFFIVNLWTMSLSSEQCIQQCSSSFIIINCFVNILYCYFMLIIFIRWTKFMMYTHHSQFSCIYQKFEKCQKWAFFRTFWDFWDKTIKLIIVNICKWHTHYFETSSSLIETSLYSSSETYSSLSSEWSSFFNFHVNYKKSRFIKKLKMFKKGPFFALFEIFEIRP